MKVMCPFPRAVCVCGCYAERERGYSGWELPFQLRHLLGAQAPEGLVMQGEMQPRRLTRR